MTELPSQQVEKPKAVPEAARVEAPDPVVQGINDALEKRNESVNEKISTVRKEKEAAETTVALEKVEGQISAQTAPAAPAAVPQTNIAPSVLGDWGMKLSGMAKPILETLGGFWTTIKGSLPYLQSMMKPLMEGFEYVKKEIQSALKALGPNAAGMMKMVGIEVPEFLKPEPKLLTAVKAAFKKADLTVEPQADDNVGAQLEQISAAHRAHVADVGSVSMDAYLAEAAAEAKLLHPGSDSITLGDVLLGAESLKAKRKRLAGVPSEKPAVATDK